MKFNFKIQQYQTDAVDSVVNCFKGQPYIDNVSYRRDIGNKRETQEYSQMSFVNNYDQGTLDFTDDFDETFQKKYGYSVIRRMPEVFWETKDNSGLQVGRKNKAVRKVFLALDATDAVIKEAAEWKADMLLTHHPLTLDGIRQVQAESLTGHKIFTLIRNDICHYAMHTNYDVVEMGEAAGEMMKLQHPEILEITGINEKNGMPEGIGRLR